MKNAAPVTPQNLSAFSEAYHNDLRLQAATNVLSKTPIADACFDAKGAAKMQHTFSIDIPTMGATNQKSSGRCWLFAALNVLREIVAKKNNIEFFELSQSYMAFWDKFERVNFFLESIIDTADLDLGDRTVAHIINTGVHDGGQWDMFVNIVKKYGLVPKSAMPETYQSSNTGTMSQLLNWRLRRCAVTLREMAAAKASAEEIKAAKDEMLSGIYGFLCSCYGEPPEAFDFEYVDKDKNYHIETAYTPMSFFETYLGDYLDNYVSIINAPTADKPYNRTYTVKYLGNVVGGSDVCYLNLPMEEFKAAILKQLEDGEVVWFGSDVGKYGDRTDGFWNDEQYNYELLTGMDFELNKAEGLDYYFSAMNHAMVLTGVNLKDGKPNRWKIENSWGDERGNKGYYACSDSWFDKLVYQAVVNKKYLGEKAELLKGEPIVLKPWDPMGSLAD